MCYTPEGAAACGSSLIAGDYGLIGLVDGHALETGQSFIHHRNVLAVGRAGAWFGANGSSSDMHYGGAYPALPTDPAFVALTPPLDARVTIISTVEDKPMTRQLHFGDFSSFQTNGLDARGRYALLGRAHRRQLGRVGAFETTFINCP